MSVPVSGEHHESDTGTDRDARCTARQLSGEHHERAVEAAQKAVIAEWFGVESRARTAIDAYHRSLAEQGVVLVDLREVVEELREWVKHPGYESAADALERRFGGVSDGD